jgi:hypothetical protein
LLEPVGPGTPAAEGNCQPTGTSAGVPDPESDWDYDILAVDCGFEAVPVNTYLVGAKVGGGYYAGDGEDAVTVYDPSLGFATAGGWFYWPGTADPAAGYPGDRTNFGTTMKYNKKATKVQGSLLLIRHLADGSIYRVKSNALYGLALGQFPGSEGAVGWAAFSGKATYLEPGWPEPEGNHEFLVYMEDHDELGSGIDRFWIEIKDKDGNVVPALSVDREAIDNAEEIGGGNIVVPHGG